MKTIQKYLLVFIFFWGTVTESISQNAMVQNIISEVNIDSLTHFVEELSGAVPTLINGTAHTILTRHTDNPNNEKAFIYIKQKLKSYNLQTDSQQFSTTGKNIFAIHPGTTYPEKQFIICAHYDNMPADVVAPGADDNASGTAAVIEAARIFSPLSFPYSIVYALWDEEEQGKIGSKYYAEQASTNDDLIMGVINLDMIAWDSDNDSIARIHARPIQASLQLADIMNQANTIYNIGLDIVIQNPGITNSDHASFWAELYSAIGLSEDYTNDFNDYYHTSDDLIDHFNVTYYEKIAKLAYATLASLALEIDTISDIHSSFSEQSIITSNYPNPFSDQTTIAYSLPYKSLVNINIYDYLGRTITVLAEQQEQAGNHEVCWDASDTDAGIYFYELTAVSSNNKFIRETKRVVVLK